MKFPHGWMNWKTSQISKLEKLQIHKHNWQKPCHCCMKYKNQTIQIITIKTDFHWCSLKRNNPQFLLLQTPRSPSSFIIHRFNIIHNVIIHFLAFSPVKFLINLSLLGHLLFLKFHKNSAGLDGKCLKKYRLLLHECIPHEIISVK